MFGAAPPQWALREDGRKSREAWVGDTWEQTALNTVPETFPECQQIEKHFHMWAKHSVSKAKIKMKKFSRVKIHRLLRHSCRLSQDFKRTPDPDARIAVKVVWMFNSVDECRLWIMIRWFQAWKRRQHLIIDRKDFKGIVHPKLNFFNKFLTFLT